MSYVVDSSVILAATFGEDGADRALDVLRGAIVSSVNLTEVVSRWVADDATDEDIRLNLLDFDLDVRPFDAAQAVEAGRLARVKLKRGFSLGDRACFALAKAAGRPIATADRVWKTLDLGVEIELIR